MKNQFFKHIFLMLTILVSTSNLLFAQESAIYAGGNIYREDYAIDELRNSGFTTVIVWTIHIASNGDLGFNGEFDLVRDGVYIGDETYPNFPADMELLKTAPTSVTRVEFGLSASTSGTYDHVRDFYESEGFGPGTTLYENFAALREAIPAIDALNNDDESEYHVESAVAFTRMCADLGFQNAIVPYTNSSFWGSLVSQVNSTHPGNIDRTYLQCYAGGSGNNPCSSTWDFGIPVFPGLWGEGSSNGTSSPAEVESDMNNWQNQCGITGGFMWLYGDFANSPQVAAYAAAINNALTPSGPPAEASLPNPSNGAVNVTVAPLLTWVGGAGATSHDFYFGTDATPDNDEFQGNLSNASFDPGILATSTTYYWRVDEVNSIGTTTGTVWSFTTDDEVNYNLAPDATISVSSEFPDGRFSGTNLVDGIIGLDGTGEWATDADGADGWAELAWSENIVTDRIVLYDRANSNVHLTSGTLTFSDGSTVSFGALNDDGSATEFTFSERVTNSVRVDFDTFSDASTATNSGLGEIEVFGNYTDSDGGDDDDGDEPPVTSLPTFYIDCDYEGGSFSLDVGSYDRQALNLVSGFVNNAVSSIEVPDGYSVTIYNRNLSQSLGTFTSNDDCLSDNGADNAMTSVVVSATNARTSTVGVNGNLESSESIMVYPNPFVDVFQIQLPTDTDYQKAKVIDLSGKELASKSIEGNVLEFDLSNIQSTNMLFLRLEGESGNEIFKLIRK